VTLRKTKTKSWSCSAALHPASLQNRLTGSVQVSLTITTHHMMHNILHTLLCLAFVFIHVQAVPETEYFNDLYYNNAMHVMLCDDWLLTQISRNTIDLSPNRAVIQVIQRRGGVQLLVEIFLDLDNGIFRKYSTTQKVSGFGDIARRGERWKTMCMY